MPEILDYDSEDVLPILRELWNRYADSADEGGTRIAAAAASLMRELEETHAAEREVDG